MPPATAATYGVGVNAASGTINRPGPTNNDSGSGPAGQSRAVNSYQDETVTPGGFSSGYGWGSSQSAATAGGGAIHLLAESSAAMISTNGGAIVGTGGSSAWGSISDSFVINVPGCASAGLCGAGAHGTMTFAINVNGGIGGSGAYSTSTPGGGVGGWSGNAAWDTSGGVNAGWVPGQVQPSYVEWLRGESVSENQAGVIHSSVTGSGAGSQLYTIEFIFGQNITFSMLGHVYSGASVGYDFYASQGGLGGSSASSAFAADLSHTMGWGGIGELRDASGQLIGEFTALSVSDSGLDYRFAAVAAVPEPGTVWALTAGLVVLAARARRLRRHL
ncbi:PEP-CTERM sorting domain-containing protein [Roseateles asaccharophilus]|nr:PEP-CTERM sorting domain-containing protein [Roseateles asaccharophilus]